MAHKRREGYWADYHDAHTVEPGSIIDKVVKLVLEHPMPGAVATSAPPGRRGGRPRTHSDIKMACVCLPAAISGLPPGQAQNAVPGRSLPRGEPVPDHTPIARSCNRIPVAWPGGMVALSAKGCTRAAGPGDKPGFKGILAADSPGAGTDRRRLARRPNRKKGKSGERKEHTCRKWHILTVVGLQAILACRTTASGTPGTTTLPALPTRVARHYGDRFRGWFLDCDRGYDSNDNCRRAFGVGMIPNIKQRENAKSKGKPHRKRAAAMSGKATCKRRGMIEGVFGAEETKDHRLLCRFRKEENRRRFGQILGNSSRPYEAWTVF